MFFSKSYEKVAIETITKAIGPAPWYWETFPQIKSSAGETFLWMFHGTTGENAYQVSLNKNNQPDDIKIVLNTYTRAFAIGDNHLGIWYSRNQRISIQCFDLDLLQSFRLSDIPIDFKDSKLPYYSLSKHTSELSFDSNLEEGTYHLHIADEFKKINEILIVDSYGSDHAAYAVFSISPRDEVYKILPQKWFNGDSFDLGYQWITRITRHPNSGRLIGDGIRIGAFELNDSGTELSRWLNK